LFPDAIQEGFNGDARWIDIRFKQRAEGAKRIEAFATSELHVESLQVAGGDVVQAGVTEDVRLNVVRGTKLGAAPANDNRELAFIVDSLRDARHHNGFFRSDDGRGRLQKNQRLFGNIASQLLCVIEIIAAHANNLGRHRGRKEFHLVDRPGLAGEFS